MFTWFLLAMGAAVFNSWEQVAQKLTLLKTSYKKTTIIFASTAATSAILFSLSFFTGIPHADKQFWMAALTTGLLNALAYPLMLKAYQIGEFSSVYSMILLTPVFLIGTSFFTLGERPTILGITGVAITIIGVWFIIRHNHHERKNIPNFTKGNILAILVAFIWSITANFDKIAVLHSDRLFSSAIVFGIISGGQFVYFLAKSDILRRKKQNENKEQKPLANVFSPGIFLIIGLGAIMAAQSYLQNWALSIGPVTYTITLKRTGVLFGVLWGWLFFGEKIEFKKVLGIIVALGGVAAIILSR